MGLLLKRLLRNNTHYIMYCEKIKKKFDKSSNWKLISMGYIKNITCMTYFNKKMNIQITMIKKKKTCNVVLNLYDYAFNQILKQL